LEVRDAILILLLLLLLFSVFLLLSVPRAST
jgi:competence protein ComGC